MTGSLQSRICKMTLLFVVMLYGSHAVSYSVLTHEELIDLAWNESIRPFLLARFPGATEAQLREAHAYAYGGSAIQDMGYYPFGKTLFSNLTHYVRTGDFIACLFQNARTLDEYAFAIGACLTTWATPSATPRRSIRPPPVEFPKLERKYGHSVTYGESPHGHIRTEFAFDVEELTDLAFAPPAYLRYIGFKCPEEISGSRRSLKPTDSISTSSSADPIPPCEAIARPCAASFRHLPRPKSCCTGINFLLIPKTRRIEFSPSASLVPIMSGTGSTLTEDPGSRPICWRFWCSSFRRSARLPTSRSRFRVRTPKNSISAV